MKTENKTDPLLYVIYLGIVLLIIAIIFFLSLHINSLDAFKKTKHTESNITYIKKGEWNTEFGVQGSKE